MTGVARSLAAAAAAYDAAGSETIFGVDKRDVVRRIVEN